MIAESSGGPGPPSSSNSAWPSAAWSKVAASGVCFAGFTESQKLIFVVALGRAPGGWGQLQRAPSQPVARSQGSSRLLHDGDDGRGEPLAEGVEQHLPARLLVREQAFFV